MSAPFQLFHGDNRAILPTLPDASIDSCVCDPPYELGFMGKKWDSTGIAYDVAMWREVFRVLKPGAHLAAFGGTRTYHRMACAIEDAGFEIRDQLAWCYGSGFPKSLNVEKAIAGGPCAPRAAEWAGWGTALKPAWEPIVLARKPLLGTVAANVLAHGTGALNIDACRIAAEKMVGFGGKANTGSFCGFSNPNPNPNPNPNRWPANFVHDGSAEIVAMFPAAAGAASPVSGEEQSELSANGIFGARERVPGTFFGDSGSAARFFYCAKADAGDREAGLAEAEQVARIRQLENYDGRKIPVRANHHPTVKPTALMLWLVRLVTPMGGAVLDCFMGSGSTGRACMLGGFHFTGIERDADYLLIARARIAEAQGPLFVNPPAA